MSASKGDITQYFFPSAISAIQVQLPKQLLGRCWVVLHCFSLTSKSHSSGFCFYVLCSKTEFKKRMCMKQTWKCQRRKCLGHKENRATVLQERHIFKEAAYRFTERQHRAQSDSLYCRGSGYFKGITIYACIIVPITIVSDHSHSQRNQHLTLEKTV